MCVRSMLIANGIGQSVALGNSIKQTERSMAQDEFYIDMISRDTRLYTNKLMVLDNGDDFALCACFFCPYHTTQTKDSTWIPVYVSIGMYPARKP